MNEALSVLPGGIATLAGGFVIAVGVIAAGMPKLLNSIKTDRQESVALKRIDTLEARSEEQSERIHKLHVKFTKAIGVLISVRLWHQTSGHSMPVHLVEQFDELLEEKQDV